MKNKNLLVATLGVAIICFVAGVLLLQRHSPPISSLTAPTVAAHRERPGSFEVAIPPTEPLPTAETEPPVDSGTPLSQSDGASPVRPQKVPPAKQTPRPSKEPLRDPLARVALILVGADSEAEDYWFGAINDPTLPPNERKDLIEDLNEEGFFDPKHPTLDELPLILSRIDLIEQAALSAMDSVNWEAFLEAHKDLVNLADLATGNGSPVR